MKELQYQRSSKFRFFGIALIILIIVGLGGLLNYLLWVASSDFREREAVLKPLLATNAPLNVVTQVAGNFIFWENGTPLWDQVHAQYARGSKWDWYIAGKMEKCSLVGHTSTIDMQTWVFFDEHNRLIDFELGSQ